MPNAEQKSAQVFMNVTAYKILCLMLQEGEEVCTRKYKCKNSAIFMLAQFHSPGALLQTPKS